MAALTSDEINFLIYRYLRESGQERQEQQWEDERRKSTAELHNWPRALCS